MIAPAGFKSITVSEAVHSDAELTRLVDRGKAALAEVLGESSPLVDVQWDVVRDDQHRPLIGLTLRDWSGEVGARFAPWEFADDRLLWLRLSSVWTRLLQAQSEARSREMHDAIRRLDTFDVCES